MSRRLPMLRLVGGTKEEQAKIEAAIVARIESEAPGSLQEWRWTLFGIAAAHFFLGALIGLLAAGRLP